MRRAVGRLVWFGNLLLKFNKISIACNVLTAIIPSAMLFFFLLGRRALPCLALHLLNVSIFFYIIFSCILFICDKVLGRQ